MNVGAQAVGLQPKPERLTPGGRCGVGQIFMRK